MIEPYRLEVLLLDTPDDDPRWAQYLDLYANGFLGKRPSEAVLEVYRRHRREDGATLGMVTATGPGLNGRQPVAGFSWAPITLNAGNGIVPAMVVNSIAVRSTHRRRGLLRALMEHHLNLGRIAGNAYAVLSASEGSIYQRFGFGVVNREATWEVNLRRFAVRPEVPLPDGSLELVDPPAFAEIFDSLSNIYVSTHRGAHSPLAVHRLQGQGSWSFPDEGPSRALRYLVHFDTDGAADGFISFEHGGWEDSPPAPTKVIAVCSPTPAIDRALWQGLASFDIVEKATYRGAPLHDPLPYSLVDPWAVQIKSVSDAVWLRLLDLPKAVSERGFESDGRITIGIGDSMGFVAGAWELNVVDGQGKAAPFDGKPAVWLDASTLSRLWFGDINAEQLAAAGLIHGDGEATVTLSKMFATGLGPANLTHF